MTRGPRDSLLLRGAAEHYDDAAYYDHAYRFRRADVAFYGDVAREHPGPVLDLGGGSGRVALPLAAEGHEITVLDASAPMLARGREQARRMLPEARRRVRFVRGDMRSFALGKKFGLVIAPFNVLLHLYEPDDFRRCFACVRGHLARGAKFVFDVRSPNLSELRRDPAKVYRTRPFRHPTLGYEVSYSEKFWYEEVKQVQYITLRFEPGRGAPNGASPMETLLAQRQIFPNELRALLALGGFTLWRRHGDFVGGPFDEQSASQVVWAVPARR